MANTFASTRFSVDLHKVVVQFIQYSVKILQQLYEFFIGEFPLAALNESEQ